MYGYPMLSNEVKKGYHYYGEGATCQGNTDLLKKKWFQIGVPVTDRHTQIAKWLKATYQQLTIVTTFGIWQNVCYKYCVYIH